MNFVEFQKRLSVYDLFTLEDVKRLIPDFNRIQLSRWSKKGYIERIGKKWYVFTPRKPGDIFLFQASNKLLQPSYISLYSALSFYNFIPEGVFTTTAVSSKKTYSTSNAFGRFEYKKIDPRLYWGYIQVENILMATPEKTLLDFFYLYPNYNHEEDFYELRLNVYEIDERIDYKKFQIFLDQFNNKALNKRVHSFLQYLSCSL